MASKLTTEQKALNKEASKLRVEAFRKRRAEYSAEIKAVRVAVELGELGRAADEADRACSAAVEARNSALKAINEKIEALNQEFDKTKSAHEKIIEPLSNLRRESWSMKSRAIAEAESQVDAKYPDIEGCYTAGEWKPISEFVPLVKG